VERDVLVVCRDQPIPSCCVHGLRLSEVLFPYSSRGESGATVGLVGVRSTSRSEPHAFEPCIQVEIRRKHPNYPCKDPVDSWHDQELSKKVSHGLHELHVQSSDGLTLGHKVPYSRHVASELDSLGNLRKKQ